MSLNRSYIPSIFKVVIWYNKACISNSPMLLLQLLLLHKKKERVKERERALTNLSRKVLQSIESSTNKHYFENTKHILIEYSFAIDSIEIYKTTSYHNYCEEDGVSTGKSNDIETAKLLHYICEQPEVFYLDLIFPKIICSNPVSTKFMPFSIQLFIFPDSHT